MLLSLFPLPMTSICKWRWNKLLYYTYFMLQSKNFIFVIVTRNKARVRTILIRVWTLGCCVQQQCDVSLSV